MHFSRTISFLLALIVAGACTAAEDPNSVLILVNDSVPPETGTGVKGASVYVGEYYATKRGIPGNRILHLNIPIAAPPAYDSEVVPFATFDTYVRQPVKAFLEANNLKNSIKYIVPVYGIPVSVSNSPVPLAPPIPTDFPTGGFSIDSYLAGLYSGSDNLFLVNPYKVSDPAYQRPHFRAWTNPLGWPMYLVTRLDGPTAMVAASLVDKAMQAEQTLTRTAGTGYFDWKHVGNNPADDTMKRARDLAAGRGFTSVLNDQSVTGSMLTSAPNALWAWGWYSGPTTCNCYTFVPGAVGAQLTSYTANRLRGAVPGGWVREWLNAGITATWGATGEPYTSGYATGDSLLNHFWMGYNFAEAAYLANPALNWAMVFVGDPLYQPTLFNDAITGQALPRISLAGAKTGQFYQGSISLSISLPTSPSVAGVTFLVNEFPVTDEITSPPYGASGTPDHNWNGPGSLTARIRYTSGQVVISDPVTALFNYPDPPAAPTFTPGGGTYTGSVAITMASATPNVVIRYTLDGTAPNSSSAQATGPVTVTRTGWVRAIAFLGTEQSSIAEGYYTIISGGGGGGSGPPAAPTFAPGGGTYTGSVAITMSSTTPNVTIRYTLDGSAPNLSSAAATGPVTVTTSGWVRAVSFLGTQASGVSEMYYNIVTGGGGGGSSPPAAPTFAPGGGTYTGSVAITMSSTTPNVTIRYTLDGSAPTVSSPAATGPVTVTTSGWVRATAFLGTQRSDITEMFYNIVSGSGGGGSSPPAAPTFAPGGGTYTGSVAITMSSTTPNVTVRYTLDGSAPTLSSPTASGPVTVSRSGWVRAAAFLSTQRSDITERYYTILP